MKIDVLCLVVVLCCVVVMLSVFFDVSSWMLI